MVPDAVMAQVDQSVFFADLLGYSVPALPPPLSFVGPATVLLMRDDE